MVVSTVRVIYRKGLAGSECQMYCELYLNLLTVVTIFILCYNAGVYIQANGFVTVHIRYSLKGQDLCMKNIISSLHTSMGLG